MVPPDAGRLYAGAGADRRSAVVQPGRRHQPGRCGDGFLIDRIVLTMQATVPGIDEAKFQEIAAAAKRDCPLPKALASVPEIIATPINVDPFRMGQLWDGMSLFWRVARRRATDAAAPPTPRATLRLGHAGR